MTDRDEDDTATIPETRLQISKKQIRTKVAMKLNLPFFLKGYVSREWLKEMKASGRKLVSRKRKARTRQDENN
jgi:hypothetical protein